MTKNLRVDVTVGIPELASETAVAGEYATEEKAPRKKTSHMDLALARLKRKPPPCCIRFLEACELSGKRNRVSLASYFLCKSALSDSTLKKEGRRIRRFTAWGLIPRLAAEEGLFRLGQETGSSILFSPAIRINSHEH